MADYYELLELGRDADAAAIKQSYRKLALRYHPDRNPGDAEAEERFKAINEAYAVLSDPERRARYDRYGSADPAAHYSGDIFDIFSSVFGAGFGAAARGPQRGLDGEDLEVEIEITLEQARSGATVEIEAERLGVCDRCDGDRAEPGSGGRRTCPTCRGAGQVRAQAQSIFGTVVTAQVCPQCRGLGEIVTDPCSACRGAGRTPRTETIEIGLPKGIDGGYRLRVPRQGHAGLDGGRPGDLYAYLSLAPHEHLTRDGDDLRFDLVVGFAQATLGSSFQVPTLDGPEVIDLPPGTQPGTELRLRGRGMPRLRQGGSGDQIVTVRVQVPERLEPRARELLEAYAEEVGEQIHERETIVKRIKGLFGGKKKKDDKETAEA